MVIRLSVIYPFVPFMRINQYLASCGLGSRRACEALVESGQVTLNGQPVSSLATRVGAEDVVKVGRRRVKPERLVTLLFHKPKAVLCSHVGRGRRTVYDYLEPDQQNLQYAGRLDYESEGLMLFSNDGALIHRLTHARFGTEKEYRVYLKTPFDVGDLPRLLKGFVFEEGRAKAERVTHIGGEVLDMVLTTGLNRQIRRMFARMGYDVKRLIRTRIGPWSLKSMPEGTWRMLTQAELGRLARTNHRGAR